MAIADEGGLVPKPLTTRREGTSKNWLKSCSSVVCNASTSLNVWKYVYLNTINLRSIPMGWQHLKKIAFVYARKQSYKKFQQKIAFIYARKQRYRHWNSIALALFSISTNQK